MGNCCNFDWRNHKFHKICYSSYSPLVWLVSDGEGSELLDGLIEYSFAGLVGVDGNEKVEVFIDSDYGHGFGVEFIDAGLEGLMIFVVGAIGAVLESARMF